MDISPRLSASTKAEYGLFAVNQSCETTRRKNVAGIPNHRNQPRYAGKMLDDAASPYAPIAGLVRANAMTRQPLAAAELTKILRIKQTAISRDCCIVSPKVGEFRQSDETQEQKNKS